MKLLATLINSNNVLFPLKPLSASTLIVFFSLFNGVYASNNSQGIPLAKLDINSGNTTMSNSKIPGEHIDNHSGKMYHEVIDMVIPGNGGMDIVISRAYQKNTLPNYSVPHDMGNWEFSLPSITGNSGGTFAHIGAADNVGCINPRPGVMNTSLFTNINRPWIGLQLNIENNPIRNLLINNGNVNSEEYADSQWLTNDGWKASCIENTYFDPHKGYLLYSPDGKKYKFDQSVSIKETLSYDFLNEDDIPTVHASWAWNWITKETYYPSKIEDINGNWIKYEYSFITPIVYDLAYFFRLNQRLTKISTSDGRNVFINYKAPKQMWSSRSPSYLINTITYEDKIITYSYDEQSQLTSVTLPNGNEIIYTYEHPPENQFTRSGMDGEANWDVVKPVLKSITFPSGGTVNYDYEQRKVADLGGIDSSDGKVSQEMYQAIKTKTLSSSHADDVFWSYEYSKNSDKNITVIKGPKKVQASDTSPYKEIEYQFDNEGINAPWGSLSQIETKIKPSETVLEKKSFTWKNDFDIQGYYYNESVAGGGFKIDVIVDGGGITYINAGIIGDPSLADSLQSPRIKAIINPYRLKSVTTERDGSIFSLTNNAFDNWLNATSATETSTTETETLERTTTKIFANKTSGDQWLIGLPDKTTVDGIIKSDIGYFDNGNIQSIKSFGVATTFTYDAEGNLASKKDANLNQTNYGNYYRGAAQKIIQITTATETREVNIVTEHVVDDFGNITETSDPRYTGWKNKTTFEYDENNRLKLTIPPKGDFEKINYSNENEVVTTRGHYQLTEYRDGWGRIYKTKEDDTASAEPAIITTTNYDKLGRIAFQSLPYLDNQQTGIHGVNFTYDALNRIKTKTHSGDQSETSYLWNDNQNSVTITDANLNQKTRYYRSYSNPNERQLIKETAPEGITLNLERDVFGKVTAVSIDGYTRSYQYNGKQFLESITIPEIGTTKLTRDAVGNIKTKQIIGTNNLTTFSYDELNAIEEIIYSDNTENKTFKYDANGNLKKSSSGNVHWTYGYDENNNQNQAALAVDQTIINFKMEYDSLDNLATLKYPSGQVIDYEPDALGRAQQTGQYIENILYHASGSPKQINYGNKQILILEEDTNGRVNTLKINKLGVTEIINLEYKYDKNGNTKRLDDYVTDDYRDVDYDGINRIEGIITNLGTGSITYDTLGNIQNKTLDGQNISYQYDNSYQLNSVSGSSNLALNYDARGNLTQRGDQLYHFDLANNLISALGTNARLFSYDAKNRMVKTNNIDGVTYSSYLGEDKLFELNLDQDWLIERIYSNGKIVAESKINNLSELDTDGDGIKDAIEWASTLNPSDNTMQQVMKMAMA